MTLSFIELTWSKLRQYKVYDLHSSSEQILGKLANKPVATVIPEAKGSIDFICFSLDITVLFKFCPCAIIVCFVPFFYARPNVAAVPGLGNIDKCRGHQHGCGCGGGGGGVSGGC